MVPSKPKNRFANDEIADLRQELLQAGLDSFQAAELISSFLSGRGYGVPHQEVRQAAERIEAANCSVECMQQELSQLAIVM